MQVSAPRPLLRPGLRSHVRPRLEPVLRQAKATALRLSHWRRSGCHIVFAHRAAPQRGLGQRDAQWHRRRRSMQRTRRRRDRQVLLQHRAHLRRFATRRLVMTRPKSSNQKKNSIQGRRCDYS